jgi:transposase
MDYDHVPGRGEKIKSVSRMVLNNAPMERILAEIAKCDLVCVLCHNRRTKARFDAELGATRKRTSSIQRNINIINEFKSCPCAICGIQYEPFNMQLDHIDPASKTIFRTAKLKSCLETTLLEELSKCQVLCALCHRRKSITEQQDGKYPAARNTKLEPAEVPVPNPTRHVLIALRSLEGNALATECLSFSSEEEERQTLTDGYAGFRCIVLAVSDDLETIAKMKVALDTSSDWEDLISRPNKHCEISKIMEFIIVRAYYAGMSKAEIKRAFQVGYPGIERSLCEFAAEAPSKIDKRGSGLRKPKSAKEKSNRSSKWDTEVQVIVPVEIVEPKEPTISIVQLSPLPSPAKGSEKRRMPLERELSIIQAYQDGKTINEIEDLFETGRSSIYRILDRNDIPRSNNFTRWTGKTHSPETRTKMSVARKTYWDNKT